MAKKNEREPPMPMWERAVGAVKALGPMTVIAIGVMYWALQVQAAKLDRMDERMVAHDATMIALNKTVEDLSRVLQDGVSQGWQLIAVNQRTCLNTAKTDADKLSCVIARESIK